MYTATEAAELIPCSLRTLKTYASRLGLAKLGPAWLIFDDDLKKIRAEIDATRERNFSSGKQLERIGKRWGKKSRKKSK